MHVFALRGYEINPFTPRVNYGVQKEFKLSFQSHNKILWCDHSNETSLAVLLQVPFVLQYFKK